MKEAINRFNHLFRDRLIRQASMLTVFLLVLSLVTIGFGWVHLPPLLPLFNQAPWGDNRLASKPFLFLPIGLGCFFMILNIILARAYLSTMPLVSRFFVTTAAFCMLLIFIFLARTFQLII